MTRNEPVRHSILIPAVKLHPHPGNPREKLGDLDGLAKTISRVGLLQPLTVTPHPGLPGDYYVIAGHRRLVAARRAGITDLPCVVREGGSLRRVMLIENCHREDLDPVEKARAMGAMRDGEDGEEPMTATQIAQETGFTAAYVSECLALLDLDAASQERVRRKDLSVAEAVAAVRRVRAANRVRTGHADRGRAASLSWEPDNFTESHPLARHAEALCRDREHTLRRRLGKTRACGGCWETVIRADERRVIESSARNGAPPVPQFTAP
jgi:ParB family transcriptional regulator, chromosome partitioning protein